MDMSFEYFDESFASGAQEQPEQQRPPSDSVLDRILASLDQVMKAQQQINQRLERLESKTYQYMKDDNDAVQQVQG